MGTFAPAMQQVRETTRRKYGCYFIQLVSVSLVFSPLNLKAEVKLQCLFIAEDSFELCASVRNMQLE